MHPSSHILSHWSTVGLAGNPVCRQRTCEQTVSVCERKVEWTHATKTCIKATWQTEERANFCKGKVGSAKAEKQVLRISCRHYVVETTLRKCCRRTRLQWTRPVCEGLFVTSVSCRSRSPTICTDIKCWWSLDVYHQRLQQQYARCVRVWQFLRQCVVINTVADRNLGRLQVAQNSLARVFCQAPRSASATKLRQQLHWLPIRQRITYKISPITYKTRTTGTPTYLSNLIHDYIPTRTLRSSNKLLRTIPRMSLAMSAKSFSLSSPSLWNSLPYNCRSTKTVTTFKRALKTELFATAYGSH